MVGLARPEQFSLFLLALLACVGDGLSMRLHKGWSDEHWCKQVRNPHWPMAYRKVADELTEWKGRVASNNRNFGHECNTRGAKSKCHRCEDIACGTNRDQTCAFQVQGMDWNELFGNAMTVSDVPWAVGGSHRADFGGEGTTHVCVMLSSGSCTNTSKLDSDFRQCRTRCWGYDASTPKPESYAQQQPDPMLAREETVGWAWDEKERTKRPQGKMTTLAGSTSGEQGFRDGPVEQALFNRPSGIAVDAEGNVYIADTENHCIRRIVNATKVVETIAGIPEQQGYRDGPANSALFNSPAGIALYYDWGVKSDSRTGSIISEGKGSLVIVISDTNNHRLRQITFPVGDISVTASLEVFTLAGRRRESPLAGYADGDASEAKFNLPEGIVADDSGIVFVADSHNHLIRQVMPNGDVTTLAGTVAPPADLDMSNLAAIASCTPPCLEGVPGWDDGTLEEATFFFPRDVALGQSNSILVVDQNMVRQVTRRGMVSVIQGITYENSVTTIAGQRGPESNGKVDGVGHEASFQFPGSITTDTTTGRMFVADTISCRIRKLAPVEQVASPVTCDTTLVDIVRPSGCTSYDLPVDSLQLQATDIIGNIHYNYLNRTEKGFLGEWAIAEHAFLGRSIKRCQGSPPLYAGLEKTGETLGPREDTVLREIFVDEDTDAGTAIMLSCPAACGAEAIYGSDLYADDSAVCVAAIHAGIINSAIGGLVRVIIHRGTKDALPSTTRNGVTSDGSRTTGWQRTFAVEALPIEDVQVATIAGFPSAPLEDSCGPPGDATYDLPLNARLNHPRGVAIPANVSLDDLNGLLYIADTKNNAIRALTAACSKICENGGACVADDTCSCPDGWTGDDCTVPICTTGCSNARTVCVGPDTCSCIPGYGNFPDCDVSLCAQTCENGSSCGAPDTCFCSPGWTDANCTTPVCDQTCGNGGNCTEPNVCNCPKDWTGLDCRTPVCRQTCQNGGSCIAPDTCLCEDNWSGHDCSLPICTQGFITEDPSDYFGSGESLRTRITDHLKRPLAGSEYVTSSEAEGLEWRQYLPCDTSFSSTWCDTVNEFDCAQKARGNTTSERVARSNVFREINGLRANDGSIVDDSECIRMELTIGKRTPFPYELSDAADNLTPLWRVSSSTPYGWNAPFAPGPDTFEAYENGVNGWKASDVADSDRMVAHVRWAPVKQGVYVCANGGNCTAPNTCKCAPGWAGFDCRTPVCTQGYYVPPSDNHPNQVQLEDGSLVPEPFDGQGLYECSIRSVTQWENASYMFEHPNYYSRYMDHHDTEWSPARYQLEEERPYYWDDLGWPATYYHTDPLGNHTTKGWMRKGHWERIAANGWTKGKCKVEFTRVCPSDSSKGLDTRTLRNWLPVSDTEAAFRAVIFATDVKVRAVGRWQEEGGECVDHVHRGCMNNGTCVGPDTCECAPGWTGSDCTIPVCSQSCSRTTGAESELGVDNNGFKIYKRGKGWCTLPDTCTCERGWAGYDCSEALCAQTCNNNGKCSAPDTCTCARWRSAWRDNQRDGGQPVYQDDEGEPQLTGWTGYDCATPICVQAEKFVNNIALGTTSLGGHGLILYGQEPYNNLRREDLSAPPYLPYTLSQDIPPQPEFLPSLREHNMALWALEESFFEEEYRLCRMKGLEFCLANPGASAVGDTWAIGDGEVVSNDGRSYQSGCKPWSPRFSDVLRNVRNGSLCNVLRWEQGDYNDGRYIRQSNDATSYLLNASMPLSENFQRWYKDTTAPAGEGIYQCANYGSCIAPDVCTCPDGYTGWDCTEPLCRHRQKDGTIVSCVNGGTCATKDTCECPQSESILHLTHPSVEQGLTGYNGTDCSIPVCLQGTFDATCEGVTAGGEGCFRCKNGGNCTAPDFCTCPPEWTGHDCGTPVCTLLADDMIVADLQTSDIVKIHDFEIDPCQTSKTFYWNGFRPSQGNCTAPSTCTCMCRDRAWLDEDGVLTDEPWQDPLGRDPPKGYILGTLACIDGYEGVKHSKTDLFMSCHLAIYVPAWYERYAVALIVLSSLFVLALFIGYILARRRARQQYLLSRAERRLSNHDDEIIPLKSRRRTSAARKKRRTTRKVA